MLIWLKGEKCTTEERLAKLEKKVVELEERVKHLEYHVHVDESH